MKGFWLIFPARSLEYALSYLFSMKGKILLTILGVALFFLMALFAFADTFRLKGIFPLQNGWEWDPIRTDHSFTGGYPGRVRFDASTSEILNDGTLSGAFWLGNVWWATFSHGAGWTATPKVNCPSNIWYVSTQMCPVSWDAWSQNSGWIVLGGADIGAGYTGTYYNPNTGNLEWWWWSQSLGWVPFYSNLSGATIDSPPPPGTSNSGTLNPAAIRFISKIVLIGNIAGDRVFRVENVVNGASSVDQDLGYNYASINHANIFNTLRKNISLMIRNIPSAILADVNSSLEFVYLKNDYTIDDLKMFSLRALPNKKRTIIVEGGNIYLTLSSQSLWLWTWQEPIALIALKDATGKGWNIIIKRDVKQIYGYLYVEGSVFSADETYPAASSHYASKWVWNIPQNQLYVRGFIASKNTIGGSQQKPAPICPVLTPECGSTLAPEIYDWDYFRLYNPEEIATQGSIPSDRQSIFPESVKKATMILEYDPSILSDPPPGFRSVN